MQIAPGQLICGVEAMRLRRALRRLRRFEDFSISSLSAELSLSIANAHEVLVELEAEGYVERHSDSSAPEGMWHLTGKGSALSIASGARPIKRETADRIVRAFFIRVETVNANMDMAYMVSDAVIFGSYLTTVSRLGDIDIGLRLIRRESQKDLVADRDDRVRKAKTAGRIFGSWFEELDWPHREVMLFLKSRSRALSIHDMDSDAIFTDSLTVKEVVKNGRLVSRL